MPKKFKPWSKKSAAAIGSMMGAAQYAINKKFGSKSESKVGKKYRRKNAVPVKLKSLQNQVKELTRVAESDMGTHIHRIRDVKTMGSADLAIARDVLDLVNITKLEEVLAQLRYYDPAAPTALVNADGTSGSYQKEFYFKRIYSKMTVRNNFQIPHQVRVFFCMPREDTSITPLAAFTNGLTDVGNPTSTSPLVYFNDSPQFRDLWKVVSSKSMWLEPGQQRSLSYSLKPFQYDPSLADSHSLTYQRRYGSLVAFIRLEGPLSHDSTTQTQVGIQQTRLDIYADTTFEVRYSAGADIEYITIDDNSVAATAAYVCSNKPVADNQSYSIS